MKHLFLAVIMAVSFVSCSGNDDNTAPEQTNPVATQYFHPPAWIQGSWKISGSNSAYFKFTNDDFILVSPYTSWKSVLQQTAPTGQIAKVNEDISDLYYQFTIIAGNSGGMYKFKRISPTRIQWINNTPLEVFLDKE
ncbi:hypothetical protein NZD88_13670 [Chryseobacterium antibioticum]|uniref:Lipocalin-like domain-containing protein n=1 Tax=Chryseobacterium pyrolae TaxID=2987481 RepID=A0ABT2IJ06_9FLAO|nr:hypothetical protein [Chryseobacterium pyrolae]MCT2408594.1 hypothetical protein [Chryseobacterium pyrolae]